MSKDMLTAEFLNQLSNEGFANYKKDVLNGPLFKKIISQIEDAALDGYKGWNQTLDNRADDIRALNVVREELLSRGFYCEFETENKRGLIGDYSVQKFVIKWGDEK